MSCWGNQRNSAPKASGVEGVEGEWTVSSIQKVVHFPCKVSG
jgi:hypothetical protein